MSVSVEEWLNKIIVYPCYGLLQLLKKNVRFISVDLEGVHAILFSKNCRLKKKVADFRVYIKSDTFFFF